MIRVAVCDDMEQIRNFFAEIIDGEPDMELAGTAESGSAALKLALSKNPDIILMDVQMETEYAGIDATLKIMESRPEIKIIVITIYGDAEYISRAYGAGAKGYILKTDSKDDIKKSIRDVYAGKEIIQPNIAEKFISQFRKINNENNSLIYIVTMVRKLTATELEILKELCSGKTRADIAKERYVEKGTVKFHVKNILKKMQYTSMAELVKDLKKLGIYENYLK